MSWPMLRERRRSWTMVRLHVCHAVRLHGNLACLQVSQHGMRACKQKLLLMVPAVQTVLMMCLLVFIYSIQM